jgi:hypothetical protein
MSRPCMFLQAVCVYLASGLRVRAMCPAVALWEGLREVGESAFRVKSQCYIATDGRPVCISWCLSPSGIHNQM